MTNEFNGVSNWTLATGTRPGERYVYRELPRTPFTHPRSDAARVRSEKTGTER